MARIGMVSLGCDKNRVDAEVMLGMLAGQGHQIVPDPETADVIIVNTCGFIEDAKQESIDAILEMAQYKEEGSCKALVVTGCLAQRYAEQLQQELPEVDALLGVGQLWQIVQTVQHVLDGEKVYDASGRYHFPENAPRMRTTAPHTAFLKIADGCNNRCAYCAIPFIRGPYLSRDMESVVAEARQLVAEDVKEIILLAQDTTAYGSDRKDGTNLVTLLQKICAIEGDFRVRVLYIYPERITDELLQIMAEEPKICKYLDIPIQHTESEVLKRMHRRGNREMLETLFDKIHAYDCFALRTTVICGFPGETKPQFEAMRQFLKDRPFDLLGAFAFSQEENTPAADMPDQVPERTRQTRRQAIMRQQQAISLERNTRRVGQVCRVLIEGQAKDGVWVGRSDWEAPDVDGSVYVYHSDPAPVGRFVTVKITEAMTYDVAGVLQEEA